MSETTVKLTQPQVFLVGTQRINDLELDLFLAEHGVESWGTDTSVAGHKLVEVAGRVCYMSFAKPRPGGNRAYINHILEVGHGSVLEHAVFNLIITGVSRSFTHELVRHRAGFGYSQLSQRFVDESSAEFVVPPALQSEVAAALELLRASWGSDPCHDIESKVDCLFDKDPEQEPPTPEEEAGLYWLRSVTRARADYAWLSDYLLRKEIAAHYPQDNVETVEQAKSWLARFAQHNPERATGFRKAAREAARSVLPNATETKIFVTGNARALRHFIEMRANPAADREICRVAVQVLKALQEAAPNLFGDYEITGPPGAQAATTAHAKV